MTTAASAVAIHHLAQANLHLSRAKDVVRGNLRRYDMIGAAEKVIESAQEIVAATESDLTELTADDRRGRGHKAA